MEEKEEVVRSLQSDLSTTRQREVDKEAELQQERQYFQEKEQEMLKQRESEMSEFQTRQGDLMEQMDNDENKEYGKYNTWAWFVCLVNKAVSMFY